MSVAQGIITLAPWGGNGGSSWDFQLAPGGSIVQIDANYGTVIDNLVFIVVDGAGKPTTITAGGSGGSDHFSWTADKDEYLIGIDGTHGIFDTLRVVQTLTLRTNKRKLEFGNKTKDVTDIVEFSVETTDGIVVGFHGGSGVFVDSIGLYLKPKKDI